jgi:hypothetical protein
MFDSIKNFFTSFKLAGSVDKIKSVLTAVYVALQKTIAFVNAVKDELVASNVGSNILTALPSVLSVLGTIVSLIAKFGPLLGINLPASASLRKVSLPDAKKDLDNALTDLNNCLK